MPTMAAGSGLAMIDRPAAGCPCPARDHDTSLPGGSGEPGVAVVLHLCLAVITLGGILSAGFLLRWTAYQACARAAARGRRMGLEYLRPPVSVPRRLAALCVLRL